ncbi:hypothetical protein [Lentibacter algarum]|nr:hypothetical protein [Lentibacter algarum]
MLSYLMKALLAPKKARSRAQKTTLVDDALLVFVMLTIVSWLS